MTNPAAANTPATFGVRASSFTVTNTTIAKVLVEPQVAAAASSPTPLFYGGASVIGLDACSTDAADKIVNLWVGEILTTQETTNTGEIDTTATTNGTITRVNGSFITDGWKIGDLCMIFTPDNTAQAATGIDGIVCTLTAVTATTLTMSGTPIAAQSSLTAGTRLVRVARRGQFSVPANSGNSTTIPSVSLLGNSNDGSILRDEIKLGTTSMLIGALNASASALTAAISITASYARY